MKHLLNSAAHAILQRSAAADGDDETPSVAITNQTASDIAEILSKDEDFIQDLESLNEANEQVRGGSFVMYLDLKRVLGNNIVRLPVPDSVGGDNPDVYAKDKTKKMAGPNKGSVYNDIFDLLPPGKKITEALDNLPDDDPVAAEEKSKKLKAARSYGRRVLKDAGWLYYQLEALRKYPRELIVTEQLDDNGVPFNMITPILLRDADMVNLPNKFRNMSASQIMNLDIGKALKMKEADPKLRLFSALMATLKNKKTAAGQGGQNNGDNPVPRIQRIAEFESYLAETAAFIKEMQKNAAKNSEFLKEVLKEDSVDLRQTIADIAGFFSELVENNEFVRQWRGDKKGVNGKEEKEKETA